MRKSASLKLAINCEMKVLQRTVISYDHIHNRGTLFVTHLGGQSRAGVLFKETSVFDEA